MSYSLIMSTRLSIKKPLYASLLPSKPLEFELNAYALQLLDRIAQTYRFQAFKVERNENQCDTCVICAHASKYSLL